MFWTYFNFLSIACGNPCKYQKLLYLGPFLSPAIPLVLSQELTQKGNNSLNLESEKYYRQTLPMTEIYATSVLASQMFCQYV